MPVPTLEYNAHKQLYREVKDAYMRDNMRKTIALINCATHAAQDYCFSCMLFNQENAMFIQIMENLPYS